MKTLPDETEIRSKARVAATDDDEPAFFARIRQSSTENVSGPDEEIPDREETPASLQAVKLGVDLMPYVKNLARFKR